MSILGEDAQIVFRIPAILSRKAFDFTLSNGEVFWDHIRFGGFGEPGDIFPPPVFPGQPSWRYVVSNSASGISINGVLNVPCVFCSDVPTEFEHISVGAIPAPIARVRVSEIEIRWNTAVNQAYQVQYRSTLMSNAWLNVGSPVVGTGGTSCVADKIPAGQSGRFYRVVPLP